MKSLKDLLAPCGVPSTESGFGAQPEYFVGRRSTTTSNFTLQKKVYTRYFFFSGVSILRCSRAQSAKYYPILRDHPRPHQTHPEANRPPA